MQQKSGANQAFVEQPERFLSEYAGILKDSPNFNEDPVELQKRMRDEKP
ncbi:MAG: hypothetical protein KME10_11575 [Plectolyngbya sp. WJT66-NPBG17]|nr:hypothetical protein [Plectolyngbya sp. WJT66-NPBG17]